jgi:RNA polymerase sigma-70 factor (ECF subfamily)
MRYSRQFLWLPLAGMLSDMGVELDDSALMLRYKEGDVAAFETLYGRHRGPLFRYLLRQIGSQQYAEDVFQEVWSRIIRNRDNYRPSAKFTTYMYHIARNCSVDHFRRRSNQQALATENDAALDTAVAPTGDPVAAAQTNDTRTALTTALNQLSVEQREAFLLREEAGLTLEEIAIVTGVVRETVKSRLRYALAHLRKLVTQPELQSVDDG